jgi:hypothetical protein
LQTKLCLNESWAKPRENKNATRWKSLTSMLPQ